MANYSPGLQSKCRDLTPFQFSLDVLRHDADLFYSGFQLIRRNAELLRPIGNLVILMNIYALCILRCSFCFIVGHALEAARNRPSCYSRRTSVAFLSSRNPINRLCRR
jgi:hypothetical protein